MRVSAETLDTDCLIEVFRNLAFFDRVRLERVCSRWFHVLQMNACYSNIKQLNIADFLDANSGNYYQQDSLLFAPTVVGIVKRCGRHAHSISFGQRWQRISHNIIDTIAMHCTRLRELDLGCVILDVDISPLLDKTAHNLEVFSLEETSWVRNEDGDKVQEYFHRMKRLRKLNIRRALFHLDRLYQLPECLQSLEMSGVNQLRAESVNDLLVRHPNLEELGMCPVPPADQLTPHLIGNLPRLIHLHIGYVQADSNNFPMRYLAMCTSLRTLHIQNCNALTAHSLHVMLDALLNLRCLSIVNCMNLLDYAALSLSTHLEALSVGGTFQLCDDDLLPLALHGSLRSVTFQRCCNVTNAAIIAILTSCPIREVTLVNCEEIGDETLYSLASSQLLIHTIAVQGCCGVTSKGVAALALMQHIDSVHELDVSNNRNIDDMAILSLHNGLEFKRRQRPTQILSTHKQADGNRNQDTPKLTIYVFKTSVSAQVESRVSDLITLTN